MVLYADGRQLAFTYQQDDEYEGYLVHLENLCVDPNLVALYRQLDAGGRALLPGVQNGSAVGHRIRPRGRRGRADSGSFSTHARGKIGGKINRRRHRRQPPRPESTEAGTGFAVPISCARPSHMAPRGSKEGRSLPFGSAHRWNWRKIPHTSRVPMPIDVCSLVLTRRYPLILRAQQSE